MGFRPGVSRLAGVGPMTTLLGLGPGDSLVELWTLGIECSSVGNVYRMLGADLGLGWGYGKKVMVIFSLEVSPWSPT